MGKDNEKRNNRVEPGESISDKVKVNFNRAMPLTPNDKVEEEKRAKMCEDCVEAIAWHEEHKKLMKKQYEIIQKAPIKIKEKRDFEYENDPEWETITREMQKHIFKQKLNEIDYEIKGLRDRINMLKNFDFNKGGKDGIQKKE